MSLYSIPAADALAKLESFSTIIDARSEAEFADDRFPGAVNWPSLNNEERITIGTIYKQVSPFEARKRGAGLISGNIARHIEQHVIDKPRDWKPLVYCWRGGHRSGSLALVLDKIGFRIAIVEGGYKAFRHAVMDAIPQLAEALQLRVICGPTGSGKTRLLQALAEEGAQVLDLEALANHRSSVLGSIPGQEQPGQRQFDTRLWEAMRSFDPARPVFVESESRKVGNVAIPDSLMERMRAAACIDLQLPLDERVALLLEDYDFFVKDTALFCERLSALTELRGKALVRSWHDDVAAGRMEKVVRELLEKHYDPGYAGSIRRNFSGYEAAPGVAPASRSPQAMRELARSMLT